MNSTTTTRFDGHMRSLYLPYGSSELIVRDTDGNSLEVRGFDQDTIGDAILDNISSRRWADDAERKAKHLAFALRVKENVERLISALQPEPVATGADA